MTVLRKSGQGHTLVRSIVLAATVMAASVMALPGTVAAQSWRTVSQSRQISGERSLDVRVKYAAGRFSVQPAPDGVLYRMNLRYDEETFEPVTSYRDGRLRFDIEGSSKKINVGRGDDSGHLELTLATALPMDLQLEFGAVIADLDLGGLALTNLAMTTGASETRLDVSRPNPVSLRLAELRVGAAQFHGEHLGNLNAERIEMDAGVGDLVLDLTGRWQRDATISVDMGVGKIEFRVPRGLGVRLTKDSFLTTVDADDLVNRGDSYFTPGYEDAERHVDIDVDAAFGKIAVVIVDGR